MKKINLLVILNSLLGFGSVVCMNNSNDNNFSVIVRQRNLMAKQVEKFKQEKNKKRREIIDSAVKRGDINPDMANKVYEKIDRRDTTDTIADEVLIDYRSNLSSRSSSEHSIAEENNSNILEDHNNELAVASNHRLLDFNENVVTTNNNNMQNVGSEDSNHNEIVNMLNIFIDEQVDNTKKSSPFKAPKRKYTTRENLEIQQYKKEIRAIMTKALNKITYSNGLTDLEKIEMLRNVKQNCITCSSNITKQINK